MRAQLWARADVAIASLSPVNPRARGKAAFFQALGFRPEEWWILQTTLLDLAQNGEATSGQVSDWLELSAGLPNMGPHRTAGMTSRTLTRMSEYRLVEGPPALADYLSLRCGPV